MDEEPQFTVGDGETWEQMAQRVTEEEAEKANLRYAAALAASMKSFMQVGFSHEQAWVLTLEEHRSRMDYVRESSLMKLELGEDVEEA